MTWPGLVLKNLLRRKVRTVLTVAGVAIGVEVHGPGGPPPEVPSAWWRRTSSAERGRS